MGPGPGRERQQDDAEEEQEYLEDAPRIGEPVANRTQGTKVAAGAVRNSGGTAGPQVDRLHELDGLRGIAAVVVVLSHCVGMVQDHPGVAWANGTLVHGLWDGASAVVLFFVLSGLVLTVSLEGASVSLRGWGAFLVKRVFRLYPAYWLVLVVAFVLQRSVLQSHASNAYSAWFRELWSTRANVVSLLQHLPLLVHCRVQELDPVVWSLVVEMKASIIFPLLLATFGRLPTPYGSLAVFCLWTGVGIGLMCAGVGFGVYVPFFALGVLLAKNRAAIKTFIGRRAWLSWPLLAIGYGLFSARNGLGLRSARLADPLAAVGSALLIVWAMSCSRPRAWLRSGAVRFLGDISYGVYLIHLPILITVAGFTERVAYPVATCLAVAVPLIVISASAIHRYVERPFVHLGHLVSRKVVARCSKADVRPVARALRQR